MATVQEDRVRQDGRAQHVRTEQPLTTLIKELRDEFATLTREEIDLAKTEMSEKVSLAARNGGYLVAGAVLALAGLIILLVSASIGLYIGLVAAGVSEVVSSWLSPLIIGGVVAVIGYAFAQSAISTLSHGTLVPQRTVQTVRDDKDWMKAKVNQ